MLQHKDTAAAAAQCLHLLPLLLLCVLLLPRRTVSSMTYRRPNMHLSATTAPNDFEWSVTDETELGLLVATIKHTALVS